MVERPTDDISRKNEPGNIIGTVISDDISPSFDVELISKVFIV